MLYHDIARYDLTIVLGGYQLTGMSHLVGPGGRWRAPAGLGCCRDP